MKPIYWAVIGCVLLFIIIVAVVLKQKRKRDAADKLAKEKAAKEAQDKANQATNLLATNPNTIANVVQTTLGTAPYLNGNNNLDVNINKEPCSIAKDKTGCGEQWQYK